MSDEGKDFFSSLKNIEASTFQAPTKGARLRKKVPWPSGLHLKFRLVHRLFKEAHTLSCAEVIAHHVLQHIVNPSFRKKMVALMRYTQWFNFSYLKKDAHLSTYYELLFRYRLSSKKVSQWHLSTYGELLESALQTSHALRPSYKTLKSHFFMPLKCSSKGGLEMVSDKELYEERRRQREKWQLWQSQQNSDPFRISPI